MMRTLALAAFVAVLVTACSMAPTTKEEVCASFDELGKKFMSTTGIYDNPVFSQAGELSSVAGRYKGGDSLKADADALGKISDSKSTNGRELANATTRIAALCGHPLALNALTSWK